MRERGAAPTAEQIVRDDRGRVRERVQLSANAQDGVLWRYDSEGWLSLRVAFADGHLHGSSYLFSSSQRPLFSAPLSWEPMHNSTAVPDNVRESCMAHALPLDPDAIWCVLDPGREYLIEQPGRWLSVQTDGQNWTVQVARLTTIFSYDHGQLLSRTSYAAGYLDGERVLFGGLAEPLLTLSPDDLTAIQENDLEHLRYLCARRGHVLATDAALQREAGVPSLPGISSGAEWRLTQDDGMLTLYATDHTAALYPGRLRQRALFDSGWLIDQRSYQQGRLHGLAYNFASPAPSPLVALDLDLTPSASHSLDGLRTALTTLGQPLAAEATLSTVEKGSEWLILQPGQSLTLRRAEGSLYLYPARLRSLSRFTQGVLDGPTQLYDNEGKLTQTVNYGSGLLDGALRQYTPDGGLLTIVPYKDGKVDGVMTSFDAAGRVSVEAEYAQGSLDGVTRLFTQGALHAEATYSQGVLHGRSTSYTPSGQLSLDATYRQGVLHGEQCLYAPGGTLLKRSSYQDGALHGLVQEYDAEGRLHQESRYKQDQLHGELCLYNAEEQPVESRYYQDGLLVSTVVHRQGVRAHLVKGR